ncbi:MAG: FABP family protein [Roseateles depolymerans]|uniref:FABP family protein n=1 Tax=Roseateles depolymerans TaxID=76731 RepID=A0A2W5DV50_9BURK|nr:MAG: FABP family protein [Roseateles depolymerans]
MSHDYPQDIYTEPEPDPDTLVNLGPLTGLAGVWRGTRGLDISPKAEGPEKQAFIEEVTLQPIDAQTNGPQLFYGLRYHTRIVKPDDPETFHDQVGYWLWEPATGALLQTLSLPRGQTAMAAGQATADAKTFTLEAVRGSLTNGIVSNPFLEQAFRTERYTITVTVNEDGSWSYEQTTLLVTPDRSEPFQHTDRNRLTKVAEPTPNPMALAALQA